MLLIRCLEVAALVKVVALCNPMILRLYKINITNTSRNRGRHSIISRSIASRLEVFFLLPVRNYVLNLSIGLNMAVIHALVAKVVDIR